MAKNLLESLPRLTKKECNEIAGALNTFGPSKYHTNPLPYNDPGRVAFRVYWKDIKDLIAALYDLYSFYEQQQTLDLVHKLKRMCPTPMAPARN